MKTFLYVTFCLVCGVARSEESRHVEHVRRIMESFHWDTNGVTFEEIGKFKKLVLIKRSGEVVGYYCNESAWERREIKAPELDGVTKIVYGHTGSDVPDLFTIVDTAEIAVWIAAYRNHTEFERRFSCFVPTNKAAGFEQKREECEFYETCMCSLALRFYAGDKKVLELKGHIEKYEVIDSGMRNSIMHELAKAKMPISVEIPSRVDEKSLIDPFAEDPTPEPPNAGASTEQPTTTPEPKSDKKY